MAGGMGGSQTTTTTPSPFDAQKAEQARLMRLFLMNNLQGGLTGQPTPLQTGAMSNMQQQNKYFSGRMGINPNEPLLKDQERSMNESLTKPNNDLLSTAMQMYTASNVQGQPSSSTNTNPGVMDYAKLAAMIAMM